MIYRLQSSYLSKHFRPALFKFQLDSFRTISKMSGFEIEPSAGNDSSSLSVDTKSFASALAPSSSSSSSTSTSTPTMSPISPPTSDRSASDFAHNLRVVQDQINRAAEHAGRAPESVNLVAVSKTKPVEYIKALYDVGHRHFGENYFQELETKASVLPADIKWHFIGHLQSSKASKLVKAVSNLTVESVDSMKLAQKLNNAVESAGKPPMDIFIQIHTSDEETKSGISAGEIPTFAHELLSTCPHLVVKGVMTIGAADDSAGSFERLKMARRVLAESIGVDEATLGLSMGMSGDFELAIASGSTNVRIGSTLFGPRVYLSK